MGIDGWVARIDPAGADGPRVAVKDAIDVAGLRLTVETTDGRRVGKVLVTRRDKIAQDASGTPGEAAPTQRRGERRGGSKR